jgi:replicative DNA helicase
MTATLAVEADPSAVATPPPKFNFDVEFQAKIAAMTMRDGRFISRVDGLIEPQYFEMLPHAQIVSLATEYYRNYRRLPADGKIYAQLLREAVAQRKINPEDLGNIVATMKILSDTDISDRDYVVDQVATFARHQAVIAAISESIQLVDKMDFSLIQKKMTKALNTGDQGESSTYNYKEALSARTAERKEIAAGVRPPSGITTGYPAFDDCLYHGGWGIGELSIIMGGAKRGKTLALMQFGINAATHGKNVLYVTLEVSSKILGARMDSNISNSAFKDLKSNITLVHDKVKSWAERSGQFIIEEFPTGSLTVSGLRRIIERWKARSVQFDMIIVDYADIMAPERYTDNTMENSKSVYVGLRGIAMEEQVALLTATQTNREGFKSSVAKAEHVADDFNKIRIGDVIISINANEQEMKDGEARLYFAASRNQAGDFSLRIKQDREKMAFITTIVGRE